ncbi:MAG: response regulator transcription factor [Anaerolineae bacterium]
MARILAVDDESSIRDVIVHGLLGHEVITADNGDDALRMAQEYRPELILLDVTMPGLSGFEVCRQLRKDAQLRSIPVIFLTAKARLQDKLEGFDAGADDYLVKPFDLIELQVRVRAVLRRAAPQLTERQLAVDALSLDLLSRTVDTGQKSAVLTPTECSLLEYMLRRPNQVLATARLLEDVWNYPPGVGDPALVRMHIKNLREKLEEDPSQPVWIQTIGRQGYMIKGTQQNIP